MITNFVMSIKRNATYPCSRSNNMTFDQKFHLNDYGTTIYVELCDNDTPLNPSLFTSGSYVFRRPDQTTFERTSGSIITSSGSYLSYTTVAGDLNQVGSWALQCKVTDGIGLWGGDVVVFEVVPNLT